MPVTDRSDRTELQRLIANLGKIPEDFRKEVRPHLLRSARPILAEARRRASWSTRIPAAMRIRMSRSLKNPGVQIVASTRRAPHARLYEFGHDRRGFRHPVFGDMDNWVQQESRPYIVPALRDKGRDEFVSASDRAVAFAARRRGWR